LLPLPTSFEQNNATGDEEHISMARVFFAKGVQGEIVRRMQRQLGFTAANIDGAFGDATFKAVKAFQTA
jgi:peptidoglycan hydrolase-like protein with peptidoglycan-binding domain